MKPCDTCEHRRSELGETFCELSTDSHQADPATCGEHDLDTQWPRGKAAPEFMRPAAADPWKEPWRKVDEVKG